MGIDPRIDGRGAEHAAHARSDDDDMESAHCCSPDPRSEPDRTVS